MSYFVLYGVLASWLLLDAIKRKMRTSAALWAAGTALLGPIILPIYLASRPLKQGEVREGGKAWNVLKNFAILWTIIMAIATVAAMLNIADIAKQTRSEAELGGAGIGTLVGIALLGAAWFFPTMGAALIGFMVKKNTVVEIGPTGPLVGENSSASAVGGWPGVIGFAALGLIAVGISNVTKRELPPKAISSATTGGNVAPSIADEWNLVQFPDKMDNTPVVILKKSGSSGSSMTIRCSKRRTDAYIDTNTILGDGSVRIKFDESAPVHQVWNKSTDDKALFAPDAIAFARRLSTARTFLLEFRPFQEGAQTISFDVTNLNGNLGKVSDACNWEGIDQNRERAKAADIALREDLLRYVHSCADQYLGKWCWSDPNDELYKNDSGYRETEADALADAVQSARLGLAFKNRKKINPDGDCVVNCAPQN